MKKRQFDGKKLGWLKAAEEFAVLVVIVFLVCKFIVGVSWVSGTSMYPTYTDGEPVVYYRLDKDYQVNDVVSIRMPSGEYYIKRVVAVAGDTVDIRDGRLYINDVEESCPWASGETQPQEITVEYPLTLEAGQIFVLGDNREGSIDSRTFGAMATSQIRGKIIFAF